MVYVSSTDHSYRFESSVRVLGETGHRRTVIHAPTVLVREIRTEIAVSHRWRGSKYLIALRVLVHVMHGEYERIESIPGESELNNV
jgi:hypothetical protein